MKRLFSVTRRAARRSSYTRGRVAACVIAVLRPRSADPILASKVYSLQSTVSHGDISV